MALMFARLARNFVKNGYFPTDDSSIEGILNCFRFSEMGTVRIFDPCCGEGSALADCAYALREEGYRVESYGIEYDAERAQHAKQLLDHVVHSDMQDCVIKSTQFQVLWLNPPYGDRVSNQADIEDKKGGRDRHEKYFLERTLPTLVFGGLLIYIIPNYVLDQTLSKKLARSLEGIRVFKAGDDKFKQVIIIGFRKKVDNSSHTDTVNALLAIGEDRDKASVISSADFNTFDIPVCSPSDALKPCELRTVKPTASQIAEVSKQYPCLWSHFNSMFKQTQNVKRRPARKLSPWHLSLLLAAGQFSGIVQSQTGRKMLVKGSTYKQKMRKVESVINDASVNTETRIIDTDTFVPRILGIDFTEGSEFFGDIFTIK
jgi:tRNA1(Val) A37 N6-methylase TrmN6